MFEINVNLFDNYFEEQERLSIQHVNNICHFVNEKIESNQKNNLKISKDELFNYIISFLEISNSGITSMELEKILSNFKAII